MLQVYLPDDYLLTCTAWAPISVAGPDTGPLASNLQTDEDHDELVLSLNHVAKYKALMPYTALMLCNEPTE